MHVGIAQAGSSQIRLPLLLLVAALLIGVMAALWWPRLLPRPIYLGCMLLALPCSRLRRYAGAAGAAALIGFGWAGLHAAWGLGAQLPAQWEGTDVQVVGRVEGLPDHELRRSRFLLRVDADAQPVWLRGRLLQLAWYDDFGAKQAGPRKALQAGTRWRMQVRLRAPRGLRNPGGFDAERHALAQRVTASGYVRAPATAKRMTAAEGLDAWRERIAGRITASVTDSAQGYIRALALGDTRGLHDSDWETLRATGLTHLIAISGFHVGLVAGFFALLAAAFWRLFPRLGRCLPRLQAAAIMALLGAAGYAALAGSSLPTVRTVLMITVAVLARLCRQRSDSAHAMALVLLTVLLYDPLSVLLPGFWLSFAGVAWLIWCLPPSGMSSCRALLQAQAVISVGLLPLTIAMFGQASLLGPLLNLIAIPWWTLVVVPLALLGTGLEAICEGTGNWAWQAAGGCFELSWWLFRRLGQMRMAMLWLPESGALALLLALAAAFWSLLPRGTPGKALALLLWLPMLWPQRELPAAGEFELLVLDVGQGLAVLVRTQQHALLYDAGPAVRDGFDAGERVVVPALHSVGTQGLDKLVISHADSDHAGGYAAVQAMLPLAAGSYAPPGAPLEVDRRCLTGDGWEWDGVRFRFLHPTRHFPYMGNESSCVLRIEGAYGTALLTGDIGEVVERGLLRMQADDLRADVVLAAHHGSSGASQPNFVTATAARLMVVSSGYGNRFGHPRAEVVQRWRQAGAEVVNTADSGALRIWLGKVGVQLREYRRWKVRLWDAVERQRSAAILSASEQTATVPEG